MYLNIEDKKIYYDLKDNGGRRALIFIHGSGGNSSVWKNQMKLGIDYDIIAIDLPSHGMSSQFFELSLNLYIDILNNLIIQLNYEKVILCGHSLGGAIIQTFYFTYPKKVEALILVGTGGRLRVNPFILESLKNDYQEFLSSLPNGAFYRKTPIEIINEYVDESSKLDPMVTFRDFTICDKFDMLDKTASITIPCLIIVGKADKLTPVKYSLYFQEKITGSKLAIIEKAGHMVMIEKPMEFNSEIIDFIKNYLE